MPGKPKVNFWFVSEFESVFCFCCFFFPTEVFLLVMDCRTCELSLDGGLMFDIELWVCICICRFVYTLNY